MHYICNVTTFLNNVKLKDVDFERKKFESVFSKKVRAGRRRTYFFDVRRTKGDDFYVTITESKKRFEGEGYERHKVFLYKEDFNRFLEALRETIEHVKTDLMPDYDYDEYTRRHEEYEARLEAGEFDTPKTNEEDYSNSNETVEKSIEEKIEEKVEDSKDDESMDSEEDMSW